MKLKTQDVIQIPFYHLRVLLVKPREMSKHVVTTQAKLTLKNLLYRACLTLKDKEREHILSLEIIYHSLPCDWSTVKQYYTYPLKVFQVTGLA